MSINTSGKWWIGSEPADINGFLEAYAEQDYEVEQFRLSMCKCGAAEFHLHADDNEGVAKRACAKCDAEHFICESDEYWEDAEPVKWHCFECGSDACNIGVGFSQYAESPQSIQWIYIGVRCARCGILGCFAGWKAAQDDATHLFDQA